jgi:hypothetical protein
VKRDKTNSALTFGTLLSSQESDAHRAVNLTIQAPGQPAKHYCFAQHQSNRRFSIQSLRDSATEDPPGARFSYQELPGSLERPAAFASRTRSNKKNITEIQGEDANRGLRLG